MPYGRLFVGARIARFVERDAVLVQVELVEGNRVLAKKTIHQSLGLGLGGLRIEPVAPVGFEIHRSVGRFVLCSATENKL